MLSDELFEACEAILKAVNDHNDYSNDLRHEIIMSIAFLRLATRRLDCIEEISGVCELDIQAAKAEFDAALTRKP